MIGPSRDSDIALLLFHSRNSYVDECDKILSLPASVRKRLRVVAGGGGKRLIIRKPAGTERVFRREGQVEAGIL
jgi:hypothetical protein